MTLTTKDRAALSAAEMQRRAKNIADQASKLAEQAGPMTKDVVVTTSYRVGSAASEWAAPYVNKARVWMAVQANRGSEAVQGTLGPRVSEMLATTARKLDPPAQQARRLPKVLAGTAMLAAGAAAAGAIKLRNRQPMPPPVPTPVRDPATGAVVNPNADYYDERSEYPVDGMPRGR